MPILDCLGGALVAYAVNMVTVEVSGSIPENEIFENICVGVSVFTMLISLVIVLY